MFAIALRGVPHEGVDEALLAARTEGLSGMDIEVMVKAALMRARRAAARAEFFVPAGEGRFVENGAEPGCPQCPLWLSGQPRPEPCAACGCVRGPIASMPRDSVVLRPLRNEDFETVAPSVDQNELHKYVDWTRRFGVQG